MVAPQARTISMIQLGYLWCHSKPNKQGYFWVAFFDPGFEGEGWPVFWLKKKVRRR